MDTMQMLVALPVTPKGLVDSAACVVVLAARYAEVRMLATQPESENGVNIGPEEQRELDSLRRELRCALAIDEAREIMASQNTLRATLGAA